MINPIVAIIILVVIIIIVIIVIASVYTSKSPSYIPNAPYEILKHKINTYKGKRILINYKNTNKEAQWVGIQTGLQHGFDEAHAYDISSIDSDFLKRNINIMSHRKRANYQLWKPYIILKTLNNCKSEDDIVFYLDSNSYFRRDSSKLFDHMDHPDHYDILIFDSKGNRKEYRYTKRDVFIALDYDIESCANSNQRTSSYSGWRNTDKTKKFLQEWLDYCQNKQLITDDPNNQGKPDYLRFKSHKGDQSIMSVLSKKYDIKSLSFRTSRDFIINRTVFSSKGK